MHKTNLCYCTPNLHKLVCQVPLCGGVFYDILNNQIMKNTQKLGDEY